MKFDRRAKSHIERLAKERIEADGGIFHSINWKKNRVHYTDTNGTRKVVQSV